MAAIREDFEYVREYLTLLQVHWNEQTQLTKQQIDNITFNLKKIENAVLEIESKGIQCPENDRSWNMRVGGINFHGLGRLVDLSVGAKRLTANITGDIQVKKYAEEANNMSYKVTHDNYSNNLAVEWENELVPHDFDAELEYDTEDNKHLVDTNVLPYYLNFEYERNLNVDKKDRAIDWQGENMDGLVQENNTIENNYLQNSFEFGNTSYNHSSENTESSDEESSDSNYGVDNKQSASEESSNSSCDESSYETEEEIIDEYEQASDRIERSLGSSSSYFDKDCPCQVCRFRYLCKKRRRATSSEEPTNMNSSSDDTEDDESPAKRAKLE